MGRFPKDDNGKFIYSDATIEETWKVGFVVTITFYWHTAVLDNQLMYACTFLYTNIYIYKKMNWAKNIENVCSQEVGVDTHNNC